MSVAEEMRARSNLTPGPLSVNGEGEIRVFGGGDIPGQRVG